MKKRIGFLIPTLHKGGAERVVSTLSKYLSKKFDLSLILFEDKQSYPFYGEKHVLNIPYKGIFNELFLAKKRSSLIKNIVKENDISLLITIDETASLNAYLSRIDYIATIHKSLKWADKEKPKLLLPFLKILRKRIYKTTSVVPSKGLANELKNSLGIDPLVIPNPIDLSEIPKYKKEKGDYALHVGRAVWQKGQEHLLRVFSLIRDKELVMISTGPLLGKLKTLKDELNLKNVSIIDTWVEDLYSYYSRANVFTLTSYSESFSMAILEAMAVGTPSVSTKCEHGPDELLGEVVENVGEIEIRECGATTPVFDQKGGNEKLYKEYSKAVNMVFENWEEFYPKCKRRAKQFDLKAIGKRWEELLKKV